jgi:hypothetical protein
MPGPIMPCTAYRSNSSMLRGQCTVERRIVLLSSDRGLVSVASHVLQNGNRMDHFASPVEVADWADPEVAAVVLDSEARARRHSYKLVRQRYRGPLIMVLDRGDRRPDLPPDVARRFLYRPFKVADLATLLAAPQPRIGPFEDAVITAWTRHASTEPPRPTLPRQAPTATPTQPPRPTLPRQAPVVPKRRAWRSTAQGRLRVWAATIAALSLLLLVIGLSNRGSCGPGCANLGGVGGVAGASESPVPLTAGATQSRIGGGAGGAQPPGSSSTPAPGPASVPGLGVPLTAGVGGLIDAISPITATDTAPPPAAPMPLPGVPPPPTTAPPTTAPPTTAPPTTAPPTTAPETTAGS